MQDWNMMDQLQWPEKDSLGQKKPVRRNNFQPVVLLFQLCYLAHHFVILHLPSPPI